MNFEETYSHIAVVFFMVLFRHKWRKSLKPQVYDNQKYDADVNSNQS
jgi:uncharacterized integral membrane protein